MATKILYIHGFGGSGNGQTVTNLRKLLGDEMEVIAPDFNYNFSTVAEIEQYIEKAKKAREEFRPNMVIGSSFGGFITTFLHGSARILINPCLLPSERVNILSPEMAQEEIEKLKALETSHDIDREMKCELYGLFGLNDELFSYLELYKKLYGTEQAYTMPSGHRIDIENINNHLIPLIRQVLDDIANFNPERLSCIGYGELLDDIP